MIHLAQPDELYRRPPLLDLLGKHDFNRASAELERKRQVMKETFILHLEALKNKQRVVFQTDRINRDTR